MIDINKWIEAFLAALDEAFAEHVWFVGLQGSYGREEATDTSDIDVVVILDKVSYREIQAYRSMLDTLPERSLICGFFAGKEELLHWEPSDLFQFYYDTKPIRGSLDALIPLLDEDAVRRAVRLGVCNIFHMCVHNALHERSESILKDLYKSAVFVMQAKLFLQTGRYISGYKALRVAVSEASREILDIAWRVKHGSDVALDTMSEILHGWAQQMLTE